MPLLGIYPARGCPYVCNFCSVIKLAGRAVRSQPVETTLASLRAAKAAADYAALRRRTFGVDLVPLPASLALSAADQELNRHAKLAVS